MRILSLLPGATEMVAALGALDRLVGITHECDHPAAVRALPRVTASAIATEGSAGAVDAQVREMAAAGQPLFSLDAERIVALAPEVILTQTVCDVCAVSEGDVRDVAARLPRPPRIVSLGATTLDGVLAELRLVAEAIGMASEGDELDAGLRARMRAVHETLKAARAPRPRVAVIEWTDPLFAAGHWTPEIVKRAGGVDVLAQPGEHSRVVTVDAVRDADPELLVFAPCGYDVARAEAAARELLDTPAWRWAHGRAAWAMDANALFSRPGPRLVDAIEVLAAAVAPASFAVPARELARRLD